MEITKEMLAKLFDDKQKLFEFLNSWDKTVVTCDEATEVIGHQLKALNDFLTDMKSIFTKETKSSFKEIDEIIKNRVMKEDEYPHSVTDEPQEK